MASKARIYKTDELDAMEARSRAIAENTDLEYGPGHDLAKELAGMVVTLIEIIRTNQKT